MYLEVSKILLSRQNIIFISKWQHATVALKIFQKGHMIIIYMRSCEHIIEQQFIVGQTDIRGYTQGKYRGNAVYSVQGEYRWNIADRFGLVGFFGMATISGSVNEADNGTFLPGGGVGFRYTAFEKNHFNIGIDAAAGKDDWGLYFRIGESF